MKKYKKIIIILYLVIFALFCAFGVIRPVKREMRTDIDITNETRIFDDADLFSDDEESKLAKRIKQVAKSEKVDFVIATTNNTEGKTAEQYSEEFYKTNGFGFDREKGTGVLLLIDMDTSITGKRKVQISGFGDAKNYIPDNIATKISNDIKSECGNGKYYLAASMFLSKAKSYMNQSASIPGFMRNGFCLFLIAAVGTGIFIFIKVKTFGMKVTTTVSTYLKGSSVRTNSRRDDFLGTTVTTRVIKHNDNDGGGSGDSGNSSGGSDFSSGGADF